MVQVGTDGGLLDSPVIIDPVQGQKLLLGNGERADVIIDFSKVAPGTVLTLMNDANTPFPDGDPVEVGTTDRIMQFIVNGKMVDRKNPKKAGIDKSFVPARLRLLPIVKLTDFAGKLNVRPDVIRQLTLNEIMSETGPAMVLLNNSRYEDMPEMDMFGDVTEKPVEGSTEKWQLINLTMDAHPMHMHLVQFQLVSRQNFDMDRYMNDYMNVFMTTGGVNGGMTGMYMGAEGPPFHYGVKNSDGAIGGNLPVTPYLLGDPIPATLNERGWIDVIIAYPNQITTYMVRFAPTDMPTWMPKPILRYGFDPSKGPGYVWHCHIVEHEDNDMMRPLNVQPNPSRLIWKEAPPLTENFSSGEFSLEQNSPNPFSSETEIRFNLPEDSHVDLILFNSIGEQMKTLIDEDVREGNQTVHLYSDNLPSGTYYYKLTAGDFISTKKLMIIK